MVSWVRAREIWVIRALLTHPKGCLKARWLVQDDGLLTGFCVVPLALTNVFALLISFWLFYFAAVGSFFPSVFTFEHCLLNWLNQISLLLISSSFRILRAFCLTCLALLRYLVRPTDCSIYFHWNFIVLTLILIVSALECTIGMSGWREKGSQQIWARKLGRRCCPALLIDRTEVEELAS